MKTRTLLAAVATALVVVTGVNNALRPPPRPDGPAKKAQPKKKKASLGACIIRRATFGGTESALLKVSKEGVLHYIVLDLPTDDPLAASHQTAWLDANYGSARPSVVGVFPSVDEAVSTAAVLCKRN